MMLIGGLLVLAVLSGVLWKVSRHHKAKNRRRYLRVRDAFTPEEREAHFNGLRRKRSAERKAVHVDDDSEDK